MTSRRRLDALRELQRLQRAERDLAAVDHAKARERADAAREAADRAADIAVQLADRWYKGRATGRIEPSLDALAAAGLVAAEQRATTSARMAVAADAEREESAGIWRLSDARERATQRIVRDAQRDLVRTQEEARLDRAAVRALEGWART